MKSGCFSPFNKGKRMINIKIGAILLLVKVNWVLVAIFKEIGKYNLLSTEVTETMFYWGYGIEN